MTLWMALLLATAVGLALTTQTGVMGYNATLAAVVAAVGGVAAMTMQARRPFYGIAAMMVTAAAFPFHVGGGEKLHLPLVLAALVTGTWLVREVFVLRRLELTATPMVGALAALMVSAVASFLAGQISWYSVPGASTPAQLGGLVIFLLSGAVLLAVAHQLRDLEELKKMTYLFLAAGAIVPFLMLSPELDVLAKPTIHPSTIGSVFWTWIVGMGAAQAWFNRSLSPAARLGLIAVFATALFHGIVQQRDWASGWVPPVIAIGVIAAVRFPRTVICGSLAVGAAALPALRSVAAELMAGESYSLMTRIDAWETLWNIVQKSPFFGVGLSNYYHFTQLYSTTGWYVKFSSHNNYMDLAAQTGFVGLFLFLTFALAALTLVLRLKSRVQGDFERAYAIGCLGCLVGSLASGMLGDWVIPFVYNVGLEGMRSSLLFWAFLGGALRLWNLQREAPPAPVTQDHATGELPSPLALEAGYGPLELEPPL